VSKLKKPIRFETTFDTYVVDEVLGEGGAGRVYAGIGSDHAPVAIKVLKEDRVTSDKRRRFKNEIAFLARNRHRNIVTVIDHGVARDGETLGLFYVMRRYDANLGDKIRGGIGPEHVLPLFSQILNGVDAAHLQGVVHRDLKPENILFDRESDTLAVADFGTARFTEDLLATVVETGPAQRLASFQYAAPEQRTPGRDVSATADIYALGLMLNEMFTGTVPHGTEYRSIGRIAPELAYLDSIVERMLRQTPEERPISVAAVKGLLQKYEYEAVSIQRLSKLDGTVIGSHEIDEPLALVPPRLIDATWDRGQLTLILDRPVNNEWVNALYNMGSYSSVLYKEPGRFVFSGDRAVVEAREHDVQSIIDHFKLWLPQASATLKVQLERAQRQLQADARAQLQREREMEEARLRVTRNIRI